MRYQALRSLSDGQPVSASMSKLLWGPWHRRLGELAIDMRGAAATRVEAPCTLDGDQALFLYTRADTIYAGSDEVQRNIISERMLGLPEGLGRAMDFSFGEDQASCGRSSPTSSSATPPRQAVRAAAEGDGFAAEQWARLTGEMELTGLRSRRSGAAPGRASSRSGSRSRRSAATLLPVPYLSTVTAAAVLSHICSDERRGPACSSGSRPAPAAAVRLPTISAARSQVGGEVRRRRGDGRRWRRPRRSWSSRRSAGRAGARRGRGRGARGHRRAARHPRPDPSPGAVRLDGAPATVLAAGPEALARARDLLSVGIAVESVGAAARCLDETVAYLKERVQFGKPIGSFQALKHRCADLATELEAARSTAYYATWAVDGAPEELAVVAPAGRGGRRRRAPPRRRRGDPDARRDRLHLGA